MPRFFKLDIPKLGEVCLNMDHVACIQPSECDEKTILQWTFDKTTVVDVKYYVFKNLLTDWDYRWFQPE